jgi:hypothetical protein
MSKIVIKVADNRISFDGKSWTAVEGESAKSIARQTAIAEPIYRSLATSHPDIVYNIALQAARDWKGEIVEYQPNPDIAIPADADF